MHHLKIARSWFCINIEHYPELRNGACFILYIMGDKRMEYLCLMSCECLPLSYDPNVCISEVPIFGIHTRLNDEPLFQ